jgi:hypothetical protein
LLAEEMITSPNEDKTENDNKSSEDDLELQTSE